MIHARAMTGVFLLLLGHVVGAIAQQSGAAAPVPSLVNYGGLLSAGNGKPLTGVVGVTFALYSEDQGGAPLWLETQNVEADGRGHYTVLSVSAT
jgi:hypothetical protein